MAGSLVVALHLRQLLICHSQVQDLTILDLKHVLFLIQILPEFVKSLL